MRTLLAALLALAPFPGLAQKGDRPGEQQTALIAPELIPPAPPLPPAEALQSFKVAPGFKLELIAAEPLVGDPIALTFSPAGAIYVLEMRGFMPNVDGVGEDQPLGRVVLLQDTNRDGVMDQQTVFADNLVMPRALALVRDGLLVAEPPHLWFFRDTNGDGKADTRDEVASDYGDPRNPEHTANGLLYALDNWIYSANHTNRFRYANGKWERDSTILRGQWGISQDDFGRLFYDDNSDHLRVDLIPSRYFSRNRDAGRLIGINFQAARDQRVWPARVNPGINRGYQTGMIRNGRLAVFTAACAPLIFRGDGFAPEFRGNAFIAEPAGNLVRRSILRETNGFMVATNAYDQAEFIASTDERFRPVNLYTGPDGYLYIVDMYRGIIQHKLYVTTYLRKQIESRNLANPTGLGRIWRVSPVAAPLRALPRMPAALRTLDLIPYLSYTNGWWRDTAQRLLVESADPATVVPLQTMALRAASPMTRLHALWTLEGMGRLDPPTVQTALRDAHPKVLAQAIRLSEPFLTVVLPQTNLLAALLGLMANRQPEIQLQLALTFGELQMPLAEEALLRLSRQNPGNTLIRDAVVSGLGGREISFIEKILAQPDAAAEQPDRAYLVSALGRGVMTQRDPVKTTTLLNLTAAQPPVSWRQLALLDGMIGAIRVVGTNRAAVLQRPIKLAAKPPAIDLLARVIHPEVTNRLDKVRTLLTWPGQPDYDQERMAPPLSAEEQARFEAGKIAYAATCAACHQPNGLGQEGLAPPLVDSEWVLGSVNRLGRIVLQGARGPFHVKGQIYELDMPTLGVMEDDQIAAALTYIRREWGHAASPVSPATIKKMREETAQREEGWTEAELLKIP